MNTRNWWETEGNIPLARLRYRWNNIRMDLKEIHWEGRYCSSVAQDRDKWYAPVKMVMNLWVP